MRRGVGPAVADIATMSVLTLLAIAPLSAAYDSADFWIAVAAGTVLGALIAVAGTAWRWPALVVAVVVVAAYFASGGAVAFRDQAIAGFIPTLDVLSGLAQGAVQVWRQTLTLQTPLDGFSGLVLAPFLLTLVASSIAGSFALRLRRYELALIPIALLLVVAIAFSTQAAVAPGILGAGVAAVALAWAAWRGRIAHAADRTEDGPRTSAGARAVAGIAAATLVVVAGAAGAAIGTVTPGDARDVLRAHVVPPLQLHDYASPMTSYRQFVTDGKDRHLFTVAGLPAGARIRLATLDAYDGIVYKVSGAGGAGSGQFTRVGARISNGTAGTRAHVQVRIGDLPGVWMPTAGYLSSLAFSGPDAQSRQGAVAYDSATGTALVTSGLASGDAYAFDTVIPAEPTAAELKNAKIAQLTTPIPSDVPDAVGGEAATITKDAKTPYAQLQALTTWFQTTGYFSDGLKGQATSRSGHGNARETDLLSKTPMIGDDEQYAVAMALMVAQLGMPVRVVMGFTTDAAAGAAGGRDVSAADVHAWVEVPFQDYGWVAFAPTPSKDRVPPAVVPQQREKPRVEVPQPPRAPQVPPQLPPAAPTQSHGTSHPTADLSWLWATLQYSGIGLAALLILFGPSLLLAAVRLRRRRRRMAGTDAVARMDGGWAEVVDRAVDMGSSPGRGATRREQAVVLDETFPDMGARALAVRADTAVFGSAAPTDEEARRYWEDVATATRRIERGTSWRRRLRARLFPVSVMAALRGRRILRSLRRRGGSDAD